MTRHYYLPITQQPSPPPPHTSQCAHMLSMCRWERDVVLLERAVLTQPNSRYELAAEYILPPAFTPPGSISQAQAQAAAGATGAVAHHHHHKHHHHKHHHHQHHHKQQHTGPDHQQQVHPLQVDRQPEAAAAASPEDGRWRLQLVVPHAAIEELLPAGQLLRQASRRSARDYSLAKSHFLAGLAGGWVGAGWVCSVCMCVLGFGGGVAHTCTCTPELDCVIRS